ncbi:MAG: aminotransferase [SAR92 bacterium BACL16 MAG-120619-bin48]|jgi:selenocysteine lyase/cysteine desulfurase|nr:MAG: aminotransferase [SAR92 bacterium BACL16 MAG-120619-bin48]
MSTLVQHVRNSIIGDRQRIGTPFGDKPLVYADYVASGRSLSFIEDFIREQVLPYYGNTHTEASYAGAQITALREQARSEIKRCLNCGPDDQLIFCGSGATAAINKLIDVLHLGFPAALAERYLCDASICESQRPVVFIGPYEHHSNELPWRESLAEVVSIPQTESGEIDMTILEHRLKHYADRSLLIGSFSAASNVTGIKSDVAAITALLKQYGALVFWDYAAAAPYMRIDMNGENPKDAVFISPHKFIGGPGTPGILVVKKALLKNTVPTIVGGGTVMYVTPEDHLYIENLERREEGGTPAIVESIRAGLVFKLQREVGIEQIEHLEGNLIRRAISRFHNCLNLEILGNPNLPRLSVISLRFKHGDKDLHYGFVVSLLNDLFGIQVRGGCSCAGPYGHSLLGMDMTYSRAIEAEIRRGIMVMRPGWVRLNFNYFIDEDEFDYLMSAIELVAGLGWKMLPFYQVDPATGVWRFNGPPTKLASSLDAWSFADYCLSVMENEPKKIGLTGLCAAAEKVMETAVHDEEIATIRLSDESESVRWFVLPHEV